MNELKSILNAILASKRGDPPAVLASIVHTEGSTYRRPGARMLLIGDRRIGSVSAGCLEAEVRRQAESLGPGSAPAVFRYSTEADDDAILGYAAGCKGALRILVERIAGGDLPRHVQFLASCLAHRSRAVVVSVYAAGAGAPVPVGSRLMLQGECLELSGAWPGDLAATVADDARSALDSAISRSQSYPVAGGRIEAFIEVIDPPVHLLLIGAGDQSMPLVRLASELGWDITVCDRREALATAQRFPLANAVLCCPPGQIGQSAMLDDRTAGVIMTHHYTDDLELLRTLLPMPLPYVGLLGSRQRADRLIQDLSAAYSAPSQEQLQRLYTPVGLDIGAQTPEEIALAIVAEIQAVLAGRGGGSLRLGKSSLHHLGHSSCEIPRRA